MPYQVRHFPFFAKPIYCIPYPYLFTADIVVDGIEETSVTINWVVPSVTQQQQYTVFYGTDLQNLDQTSATVLSNSDTSLTNQQYFVVIQGLQVGTTYYFQISVSIGDLTFTTDVNEFRTRDLGNYRTCNVIANVNYVSVCSTNPSTAKHLHIRRRSCCNSSMEPTT